MTKNNGSEVELAVKILEHVRSHQGCSWSSVCSWVPGKSSLRMAALHLLEAAGDISRPGSRLYARP